MTGAEVDGRAAVRYTARFAELDGGDLAVAGGKGANLGELVGAGLPVPAGFVLTTAAYDAFVEARGLGPRIVELARGAADPAAVEEASGRIRALFTEGEIPDAVRSQVLAAYAELGSGAVAVRSSATAEDLPGASFAGQQDSFLNVRGADALLAAVRGCWASLWTARAMGYRARQGIDPASVSLAVVVQQMVEADAGGAVHREPGQRPAYRDGISAWGLGESVVGGAVDTDDLVVDPAAGRVLSRRTADKAVLTDYARSGTEQRPVPYERRRATVLDDATAVALARLGARAEAHFGAPQDLEWARAGGELYVVQARPITALPEPEAAPPTDWSVPDAKGFYFRASIVEQLPDPLSPLFADLVDGSVTRSLGGLFAQVFGDATVRAGELGLPTVNGYAYYYYSRAAMMRLLRLSPAAMRAVYTGNVAGKLGGIRGWREHSHPAYQHAVAGWVDRDLDDLTADGLLAGTRELLDAATVYYTAVQSIIPVAATAEITFSGFYNRLVRRAADPAPATLLVGFDSIPIRAEKSLHDLATWTKDHPALAQALSRESSRAVLDRLGDGPPPTGVDPDVWAQWRARFAEHLDRYGHTNLFTTPRKIGSAAMIFQASAGVARAIPVTRHGLTPRRLASRPTTRPRCWTPCGSTCAARAVTRTNGRPGWSSAARPRPRRCAGGSTRRGAPCSTGCWPGRRTPRRCARTAWPTSGWPGRRCAACCWSWATGSPPPARWAPRPTCSGCATTSWHPWPRRGTAGSGR